MINCEHSHPSDKEIKAAASTIETLKLEGIERYYLTKHLLETALNLLTAQKLKSTTDLIILGQPLQEVNLRRGLEKTLRDIAHLASGEEKIQLVDQANQVRPRTLV